MARPSSMNLQDVRRFIELAEIAYGDGLIDVDVVRQIRMIDPTNPDNFPPTDYVDGEP